MLLTSESNNKSNQQGHQDELKTISKIDDFVDLAQCLWVSNNEPDQH